MICLSAVGVHVNTNRCIGIGYGKRAYIHCLGTLLVAYENTINYFNGIKFDTC